MMMKVWYLIAFGIPRIIVDALVILMILVVAMFVGFISFVTADEELAVTFGWKTIERIKKARSFVRP